jgi:hypothetical protein
MSTTNTSAQLKLSFKAMNQAFRAERRSGAAHKRDEKSERKTARKLSWVLESITELTDGFRMVRRGDTNIEKHLNAGETIDRVLTICEFGQLALDTARAAGMSGEMTVLDMVPVVCSKRFGWQTVSEHVATAAALRGVKVDLVFKALRIVGDDVTVVPSEETTAIVEAAKAQASAARTEKRAARKAARGSVSKAA